MSFPDLDDPDLAATVERLGPDLVDTLPFGVIRLDADRRVVVYNETERRMSGNRQPVIGRHLFGDIAPCLDTPAFAGRLERALAAGRLDLSFVHVGDFSDLSREIRVRVQSASGGGCWIFTRRDIACDPRRPDDSGAMPSV